MNIKIRKTLITITSIIIVIFLVIIAILTFNLLNIKKFTENNKDYLFDTTKQTATKIDSAFLDGYKNIHILSKLIGDSLTEPKFDVSNIQSLISNSVFDFIEFADINGFNHNVTGGVSDAKDRQYYIDGIKGNIGMELIYNSRATHETLLMFYAPVYYKEEVIGSIVGVYQANNKISKLINATYFGEKGISYLCDPTGRVVASNIPTDTNSELYITDIVNDNVNKNNIKHSIETGKTLIFSIDKDNTSACITKIPKSGWFIVEIFPQEITKNMATKTNILKICLIVSVFIVIISIFFMIYVLIKRLSKKEERQRIEYTNKLKRNLDIINILASNYSSVYYINLETDELIPYTMDEEIESAFGQIFRSGIKYSQAYKMYVDKLIYDFDKEMMLEAGTIDNIKKQLKNKKVFDTQYRIGTYGNTQFCQMRFVKVNPEKAKPTAVALGFSTNDRDIVRKYTDDKLHKEYASIFLVDMETDTYRFVYRNDDSGFEDVSGGVYSDTIKEYISRVDSKYQNILKNIDDINHLKNILKDTDRKEYTYTLSGQEKTWRRVVIQVVSRKNNIPNMFIMTYITIDNEQAERLKLSATIEEQNKQLEEQQKALEYALEIAQASSKAKTVFLSNMSHDIRTPMNAIIGFTDLAKSSLDNKEKITNYLDKITQSSKHLLSLINDILDMSRIESGKTSIKENRENIKAIVSSLESLALAHRNNKKIDFITKMINIKNENVYCDKLHLTQILINIVSNALKYTNDGGTIVFTLTEKDYNVHKGYSTYEFKIKDNGIGMSEDFLKTIFNPFTRATSSTISGVQGTGLGMTITKSLIDIMNGEININSKENEGTEVIINFEFKIDNSNIDKITKQDTIDHKFIGKKLLLVEDNEFNLEIATELLANNGFIVTVARDGSIAYETMKNAKPNDFDIILMDIQMPTMDGYTATKLIRSLNNGLENIPIIAMTANAFVEDRLMAISKGMNEHIAKPIDLQKLKEIITKFL